MIIDNTKPEFEDIPDTLNGRVLLDRPPQGGFLTCEQETAYLFSIATPEQQAVDGYDTVDLSTLDKVACNKPTPEFVANWMEDRAQKKLNALPLPDQAKTAMQNRVSGLLTAMRARSLDDGLRLALQLPIDIDNTP